MAGTPFAISHQANDPFRHFSLLLLPPSLGSLLLLAPGVKPGFQASNKYLLTCDVCPWVLPSQFRDIE